MKEFFTFTTERGDTLNAYMVKPRGFDPSQRYPVLLTQYSGPGSQSVRDRWSLDWEDALADKGYIVVCADGRGTGFRGEKFKKLTYGRLGALEVEDQLSTARHMAAQPWVDPARIGIYGWSYGGFMALSCAMKGLGLFKMAIAVAPVTSWRYYDTIYTEIYNNLPQYNAAGYDDNSPINFARMLDDRRTRLLIIHGTADDNVHFQNTVEMTRALNRAGKQYDMMVYPDQNHSMLPDATAHIRQKDDRLHSEEFMTYTLQHETPVGPVTITATGEAVTQIRFGTTVPEGSAAVPETAATPLLLKAAAQLREYFAGTRRDFSLPLAPAGTPFQQSVWQALQTIPYGETRTYGHIAMQIGHNKSFRAVGMANNRNPIVIVIPCHRVLGYDGKLTGYAGGLDIKERLLALEKRR